jgi:hypothetical protein
MMILVLAASSCSDGDSDITLDPTAGSLRVPVYEAMIRKLYNPQGTQPVYISTDLCFYEIPSRDQCPGRLSIEEAKILGTRLRDLGDVKFYSNGQPLPWGDTPSFQSISLSPIIPMLDGFHVEAGAGCGTTCGIDAVYILAATSDGFEVTGFDDRYGIGVA